MVFYEVHPRFFRGLEKSIIAALIIEIGFGGVSSFKKY